MLSAALEIRPPIDIAMTGVRSNVPIVFLSSTSEDLRPHRAAARDAAIAAEFLPRMMEHFEARGDHPPLSVCIAKVAEADLVVAIVAHRYGWVPPDQPAGDSRSISWLECEAAVQAGKELLVFMVDESHAWPVELREEYRTTAMLLDGEALTPQLSEEIQRNIARLRDFKKWLNGRGVTPPRRAPLRTIRPRTGWGRGRRSVRRRCTRR